MNNLKYEWVFDNRYNTKVLRSVRVKNGNGNGNGIGNGNNNLYSNNCNNPPPGKIKAWGNGCTVDSDCCCVYQTCKTHSPGNTQCVGDPSWPGDNEPFMTHYWDCCMPSCAQPNKSGKRCTSCISGKNPNIPPPSPGGKDYNICNGGKRGMCFNQIPWVEDNVLYGYGAAKGQMFRNDNNKVIKGTWGESGNDISPKCGDVYEVTFDYSGAGEKIKDSHKFKKAYLMFTNGGDSLGQNIDLAIPGGGFGEFNGCLKGGTSTGVDLNPNWNVNKACNDPLYKCTEYGGFSNIEQCDIAFKNDPVALKACKCILFRYFGQMGCNYDSNFAPNLGIKTKKLITDADIIAKLSKGNPDSSGPVIPNKLL